MVGSSGGREGEGAGGELDGDGNEGDGGGNSSKMRGCGKRCWALAGAKGVMAPLPRRSKGTQEIVVTNAIGRLNGLENCFIALWIIAYESIRGLNFSWHLFKVAFGSSVSSLSLVSFTSISITASTNSLNA